MKTIALILTLIGSLTLTGCKSPMSLTQLEARDESIAAKIRTTWPDALVCVENENLCTVMHDHKLYRISLSHGGQIRTDMPTEILVSRL